MAINDFSSLIQLSATLSIAFVAVEYVKFFTKILNERVFRFDKYINHSFNECLNILTDEETLSGIPPLTLNGKSTNARIEKVKRVNESLRKTIRDKETGMKEKALLACYAQSMPAMCFFLFMCDILILFFGGIENRFHDTSHSISTFFCLLSILYLICGWCIGENQHLSMKLNFSSLRHAIFSVFTILALSIILCILRNQKWIEPCLSTFNRLWWYSITSFVVLTFINYVVFMVIIWKKTKRFKKEVEKVKSKLREKCEQAKKEEQELLAMVTLDDRLKTD